jgi:hypothetical protein
MPAFEETSEEAVKTAETTLATIKEQIDRKSARGGCKDICCQREADQRAAAAALQNERSNRAATVKATELDGKIAAARAKRDKGRHRHRQ